MRIIHKGHIGEDGWWRIKARFYYNKVTYPDEIEFLVDTGAQYTVLSNQQVIKLGLPGFKNISDKHEVDMGGAGSCKGRPLFNVGLVFSDACGIKNFCEPCTQIYVPDPDTYRNRGNLLGRDIINRYNVIANNKRKAIVLIRVKNNYIAL